MPNYNLSFTACSFHVKKAYTPQTCAYDLNKAFPVTREGMPKNMDISELFSMFVAQNAGTDIDSVKKRVFYCKRMLDWEGETKAFRYWYMQIISGEYGSSADLIDVATGKNTYNRSAEEAEVRPFVVFVVIPKQNQKSFPVQKGMFFFQNVGPFGIKTVTITKMNQLFSEMDVTLTCKTISSGLFFSKVVKQSSLLKIQCVKNVISEDRADRLAFGYGREVKVLDRLQFSTGAFSRLLECLRSFSADKRQLFEFEGIGRGYDNVKLVVDIGGRNRVIDLHNMENLSIIEGIPDEIKAMDGHLDMSRLIPYFIQTAEEYLSQMVLHF